MVAHTGHRVFDSLSCHTCLLHGPFLLHGFWFLFYNCCFRIDMVSFDHREKSGIWVYYLNKLTDFVELTMDDRPYIDLL